MTPNLVAPDEFAPYYKPYIDRLDNVALPTALEASLDSFLAFLRTVPVEKITYRYAEGKWTIKDIVLHLMDSERIFAYRALRIARQDQTPLPGFDENQYAISAQASARNWEELLVEFSLVRQTTQLLFRSFSDEQLCYWGTASGNKVSVRALGFIIVGHQKHHEQQIKQRYL